MLEAWDRGVRDKESGLSRIRALRGRLANRNIDKKIETLYENIRRQAVANQRLRDEISSGRLIIVRSADALQEIREA